MGWLQLLVILFWIFVPAFRTNAIYVPDSSGNPYWVPLTSSDTEPADGPEPEHMVPDGNGGWITLGWQETFQAAVNSQSLVWWGGGSEDHGHPFVIDGVGTTFLGQWHSANDGDADHDGIPDSLDKYPGDAANNSYWWPGGGVQLNGKSYHIRAQWFAGSGEDGNNNGVPDCMEAVLQETAPGLIYWPGGYFLLDGQMSFFYPLYFYGYDSGDITGDAGDIDGDGIPNALDPYPNDVWNNTRYWFEGGDLFINGLSTHFNPGWHAGIRADADGDGLPDDLDPYPNDFSNNTAWWPGGTFWMDGVYQTVPGQNHAATAGDRDGDGIPDDIDPYPDDATNRTVGWAGGDFNVHGDDVYFPAQNVAANAAGNPLDADADGIPDTADPFPNDRYNGPAFIWPPLDANGAATTVSYPVDADNHPVAFTSTLYYGAWLDTDGDGIPDVADPYPGDYYNGNDTDGDGIPDSVEVQYGLNPNNPADANSIRNVNGQIDGVTWKQAYDHRWLDTLQDYTTDTDGDGMSDLYEVLNGLNPNDPSDAVDAPVGHIPLIDGVPVIPPVMNDFILNIEKARAGIPIARVVTDMMEFWQITGQGYFYPPPHDFLKSVALNDWDGDGVSNQDEVLFGTNPRNTTSLPTDAQLVDAYIASQLSATTIAYFYDALFSGLDVNSDGIPDGIERTYGITPANADTVRSIGGETDGLTWREAWQQGYLTSLKPCDCGGDQCSCAHAAVCAADHDVCRKCDCGGDKCSCAHKGVCKNKEDECKSCDCTHKDDGCSCGHKGECNGKIDKCEKCDCGGNACHCTSKGDCASDPSVCIAQPACTCGGGKDCSCQSEGACAEPESEAKCRPPTVSITGVVPNSPNDNNDEGRPEPGENDTFPFPKDNDNEAMLVTDPDIALMVISLDKANTTGGSLKLHVPVGYRVFSETLSVMANTSSAETDVTLDDSQTTITIYAEGLDNVSGEDFKVEFAGYTGGGGDRKVEHKVETPLAIKATSYGIRSIHSPGKYTNTPSEGSIDNLISVWENEELKLTVILPESLRAHPPSIIWTAPGHSVPEGTTEYVFSWADFGHKKLTIKVGNQLFKIAVDIPDVGGVAQSQACVNVGLIQSLLIGTWGIDAERWGDIHTTGPRTAYVDALQHAYWNALCASDIWVNRNAAIYIATAHEFSNKWGNDEVLGHKIPIGAAYESTMDLRNNMIGINTMHSVLGTPHGNAILTDLDAQYTQGLMYIWDKPEGRQMDSEGILGKSDGTKVYK